MRIRVLIASLPPLLADIVRDALADDEEVDVLGGDEGLERAVEERRPHVLISAEPGARLTEPLLALMYRHPMLRVLLITAEGRSAALYRLVPERRVLADPTPRSLAEAVRAAGREG